MTYPPPEGARSQGKAGESSTERRIVMDMSGSILVNLATFGLTPKPQTGLGQVAAIARGRAYVD